MLYLPNRLTFTLVSLLWTNEESALLKLMLVFLKLLEIQAAKGDSINCTWSSCNCCCIDQLPVVCYLAQWTDLHSHAPDAQWTDLHGHAPEGMNVNKHVHCILWNFEFLRFSILHITDTVDLQIPQKNNNKRSVNQILKVVSQVGKCFFCLC